MIKCTFMPTFLNNEQNQIMYSQATQLYATLAFTIRLRVRRSQDYGHGLSHRISCRDNETQTTRNDEKRKIKKETLENTKNHKQFITRKDQPVIFQQPFHSPFVKDNR
jgi:hypothetical protein